MYPIIDADGHLDENAEEIVQYLDEPLKGRTEIGRTHGLFPSWGALTHRSSMYFSNRSYSAYRQNPSPEAWLAFADQAGIEQAVLYPTAALGFAQMTDTRLAPFVARAYNSWAHDRYMGVTDRLQCVAILPLHNIPEAVKELRRVRLELGMTAVVVHAGGLADPLGNRQYWPVYEAAQETDTFIGVHGGGGERGRDLLRGLPQGSQSIISHPTRLMAEMVSMMFEGVFEEFPSLKTGFLEAGCTWLPYLLDRMDDRVEIRGSSSTLQKLPSAYVRDCPTYFAAEPWESLLPTVVERIGADHIFCASDFPHEGDEQHTQEHLEGWEKVSFLSEEEMRMILNENAKRAYSLA